MPQNRQRQLNCPPRARPAPDAGHADAVAGLAGVTGVTGVEGGVEGGILGGAISDVVGGLVSEPAPPPPTREAPVRIGGQIQAPSLIHRVEPVYPVIASVGQLTGLVILEAVVDETGRVESVTVLRSRHPLLDNAASDALKQWRYKPLVLNRTPTIGNIALTRFAGGGSPTF